jgi:manganese/zinc/iron transport system substrate-binding protein
MKETNMKQRKLIIMILIVVALSIAGCSSAPATDENGQLIVVSTTTMLADLARVIGGEHVTVIGLMGPGIDPHLYSASVNVTLKLGQKSN